MVSKSEPTVASPPYVLSVSPPCRPSSIWYRLYRTTGLMALATGVGRAWGPRPPGDWQKKIGSRGTGIAHKFERPRSERTVCEADDRDQKSRDCERGSNRITRDLGQRARLRLKLLHDIVNATALAYREHAQETQVFAQSAQLAE